MDDTNFLELLRFNIDFGIITTWK